MTFMVGELASEIRLEGQQQYIADLDRMGVATGQLATKNDGLTKAMRTGFQFAAATITTAAAAGAALGVSVFKTGAAYNTLQQTSRAALSTLLGGAEQANAQMDKLDAFARTSPFAKDVFIRAQQQLIGFGLEAGKVVPTLDAIQQSVAAVGGSNQDIEEITRILATVISSGKITAETLNQLGVRGVDAATLIGNSLGKSGDEIRESITEGTLDAGVAVQALTDGMQARFGGAADNVKKTWVGTTDRIKAGTREIGVALAEPFISQQGGGMAVQWGNQVADVLQGIRGHAQPVVGILVGALTPAFDRWTGALDAANIAVRSWDSSRLERFLKEAPSYAPQLGALTGAIFGLTSGALSGIPVIGRLIPAINPLAGALIGVALATPGVREGALDVLNAFRPLIPVATDLAQIASAGLTAVLPVVADGLGLVADVARPLVQVVAAIPAPVLAAAAGFLAVRSAVGPLAPLLKSAIDGLSGIAGQVAVQSALARMEGNTSAFAGALGVAKINADRLGTALKAAFISNPVGLILLGVSTAVAILTAAFSAQAEEARAVKERVQGYKDTLQETTGAVTDLTRAQVENNLADGDTLGNLDKLGIKQRDYVDALLGNEAAQGRVNKALAETRRIMELPSNERSWSEVFNDTYKAGKQLVGVYGEQEAALAAAAEATRRAAEEERNAAAAKDESVRSNERLNQALGIARDVSRDATERLRALKLALDELNGGTRTQEQATRDLNEQTDRLREVFAQTDENGNKLATSLVNAAGVIDTTTAAGRSLFDETSRLNDQMLDAILSEDKLAKARGETGVSTERAAAVAQPYIDRLREIAAESGLSEEQVAGLVSTMMETPQVVAFLVDDNGTIDVKQQELLGLARQILATPDKQFEVSSDDFPGLHAALSALGFDIRGLPAGTVKVRKDDGSFATVEEQLNSLARARAVTIAATVIGGGQAPARGPLKGGYGFESANGNLFDGPGRVQSFNNGGFPTGIFTGGLPIYKFAEPEVGWEAFISGRAGQEDRNLAIASEAVSRLGGKVLTPAQLRQGIYAGDGGQTTIDRRVNLTMNAVPEPGTPLITQVMAVVRRLEARQARKD